MAKKISALTELTALATGDEIAIVDDSASETKKVTVETLSAYIFPVGMVAGFTTSSPPTGFLECDGSAISRTTYDDLFGVISDDYGNGDGSTTFNLPDYRGEFLRGFDNTAGNDPDAASRTDRGDSTTGDAVGTKQGDQAETTAWAGSYSAGGFIAACSSCSDPMPTSASDGDAMDSPDTSNSENRPRNVSIMWCIKY